MSDLHPYLWLIPALPLAASVVTAFLGPRLLRQYSHWPCILAGAGSFVVALLVFVAVYRAGPRNGEQPAEEGKSEAPRPFIEDYYPWIQVAQPITTAEPVRAASSSQQVVLSSTQGLTRGSELKVNPGNP